MHVCECNHSKTEHAPMIILGMQRFGECVLCECEYYTEKHE